MSVANAQTSRLQPTEPPFECCQITHHYEVLDDASTTHRAEDTYWLRARSWFRFFEHRYRWTGSGVERPPRVLPSSDDVHSAYYRIHGPLIRDGENRIFLIDMARDVAPDEDVTVRFEQDLIDHHETFEPRLRKTIRTPIDKLILQVLLPPALRANVRATVRDLVTEAPAAAPVALAPEGDEGVFRYEIDSPVVGQRYAIEWT